MPIGFGLFALAIVAGMIAIGVLVYKDRFRLETGNFR